MRDRDNLVRDALRAIEEAGNEEMDVESLNENQSLLTFVQNGAKKQTGRRGDAAQQGWQASSYYEYPAFSMATSEMV